MGKEGKRRMTVERGPRCIAFGIVPDRPSVFWDYDVEFSEGMVTLQKVIRDMGLANRDTGRPFQVYRTKHGLHMIIRCKTWDEAQDWLYYLKAKTHGQSIMNCRKQRIRVSPKIAEIGGEEVSPVPKLIWSNWGPDLRTGKKEVYYTYDEGLNCGDSLPE